MGDVRSAAALSWPFNERASYVAKARREAGPSLLSWPSSCKRHAAKNSDRLSRDPFLLLISRQGIHNSDSPRFSARRASASAAKTYTWINARSRGIFRFIGRSAANGSVPRRKSLARNRIRTEKGNVVFIKPRFDRGFPSQLNPSALAVLRADAGRRAR